MRYLSTKEIIKINAKVILRHSPGEMIGVKDANALDMAVKQPSQAVFNQELYPEVYEKAAILAFIIMITTSSLDFDSLKSKITNYLRQTAIK